MVDNIMNTKRNQFFWKMVGPVIIAAIGNFYRQMVGMVKCPHQMIGRCFGSGIGTARVVGGLFGKKTFRSQGTIYFIGGDMVKYFIGKVIFPKFLGSLQ